MKQGLQKSLRLGDTEDYVMDLITTRKRVSRKEIVDIIKDSPHTTKILKKLEQLKLIRPVTVYEVRD